MRTAITNTCHMKNTPKSITSEVNDSVEVTGFDPKTESFLVDSPIASHYKIETAQFCALRNGILTAIGISSADPELYRKWLHDYKEQ